MKVYLAGPSFTTPERTWNAEVTAALRAAGREVFRPQEQEAGKDGPRIFATDVCSSAPGRQSGSDATHAPVTRVEEPGIPRASAHLHGVSFGSHH
jgi:hypothetical protein